MCCHCLVWASTGCYTVVGAVGRILILAGDDADQGSETGVVTAPKRGLPVGGMYQSSDDGGDVGAEAGSRPAA